MIFWEDVERCGPPERPTIRCNYCHKVWRSNSVTRVKEHMKEDCKHLPNRLWARYGRGTCAPKRGPIQDTLETQPVKLPAGEQQQLDQMFAEFVYASGMPFNTVSIYLSALKRCN